LVWQGESASLADTVDFKSYNIEGQVANMKWCNEGKNVLVLTDQNHLYRSTDFGRNWTPLRNKLLQLASNELEFEHEQVPC
jgi:photosystem II stability/assembly factor-like uncharacterized protein